MARPKKDNADYFSHDKGMRNDRKVKALRRKFTEGYMVYNMLLEVLTEANFFSISLTPIQIELLAGDFDVDPDILSEIIRYCIKIELLTEDGDLVFSSGLKKRLQPVLDNRNAVKQRFLDKKLKSDNVSKEQNTQSKVKYSIVKESKLVVEDKGDLQLEKNEESENSIIPILIDEGCVNEEEKIAAVNFLKTHSMFALIQKQQSLKPPEVIKLFETFYETKSVLREITGKSKDEVLRHFLYWVPKYQTAKSPITTPRTTTNGTSNNFTPRNRTTAARADELRDDRNLLVDSLRGLLRGTAPKE
jgi:hypothetical protein